MLIKKLEYLKKNPVWLPHLDKALICLAEHKYAQVPSKFEFSGGYILLQEGMTKDIKEGDFEAHQKYLDVQVLLEGVESVEWNDISSLQMSTPYDLEKDKVMYAGTGARMTFVPGTCYVFWPEDGHKTCRHILKATHYRKAVIKLEL